MNRRDYNPAAGMLSLREAMNRLLEDSFVTGVLPGEGGRFTMPLDVSETRDALVVRASLPGVQPDDIDITVTGDTLTIRGEIKETPSSDETRYHQREHRYGMVSRSMALPVEVQSDKVEATFEHGVLTLTMPKAERMRPKTIRITTRGGPTTIEAQAQPADESAGMEQGSAGTARTQTDPSGESTTGPSDEEADQ